MRVHDVQAIAAFAPSRFQPQSAPPGDGTYRVKPGDGFVAIAGAQLRAAGYAPTPAQVLAYAAAIAAQNGMTLDSTIHPGDTLALPPVPADVALAAPDAPLPPPPGGSSVVTTADGLDDSEATYLFSTNFGAIDADGNGQVTDEELDQMLASGDPASPAYQAAQYVLAQRGVEGGLYERLDFGAGRGDRHDDKISLEDVANLMATTPMPAGLGPEARAAFVNAQLAAVARAVDARGYDQDDAARLIESILAGGAADDPAVAGLLGTDTLLACARILGESGDDTAAITRLASLLALRMERQHADYEVSPATAAALGQLFERYLQLTVGDDPAGCADMVQQFVTDAGFERLGLGPYALGSVCGALVGGTLSRLDAIEASQNDKNALFGQVLTGLAAGFAIASAAATGGATSPVALAAVSAFYTMLETGIGDAPDMSALAFDTEARFRAAFENLQDPANGAGAWTPDDTSAAIEGLEMAINACLHPS